jgi:hypothetical protein
MLIFLQIDKQLRKLRPVESFGRIIFPEQCYYLYILQFTIPSEPLFLVGKAESFISLLVCTHPDV